MVKREPKKATAILFTITLLLLIFGGTCVYAEKNFVNDQAKLFTSQEASVLAQEARTMGEKYSLDVVIVTTENGGGKSSREYADDFFDYNGYGLGEDRNGILFLIDMDNREAYISTSGSGIRYLTDERRERVLDDIFAGGLSNGDMYGAAKAFLKSTEEFLEAGIPVGQYNVPESGANSLSVVEGIAGAGVSGGLGLGFFSSIKRKYRSKPKPQIFEYRRNSSVNLGNMADNMVNTYVTTRIIPKVTTNSSGSGSGRSTTHRSSSGRIHGGGGRKF